MASNTPTLKDIAQQLGLSIGTVQRALRNKGGYSKETQELILREAKRCGYTANPAASALRRAPINLAVMFPRPEGENRYFFQYVWKGIEKACQDLAVYHINIRRYYTDVSLHSAAAELESILRNTKDPVQGLISNASNDPSFPDALDQFAEKGIPAFIVNATPGFRRPLCYSANANQEVGKLGADLFTAIHHNTEGKLLLLGGARSNPRHVERVNDFYKLIAQGCPNLTISELHIFDSRSRLKKQIETYLTTFDDLVGIYAATARETLCMCETIHELALSRKVTAIGTDVFPELLPFFESGILTASVYQYPAQQAYVAVKTLVSHIAQIDGLETSTTLPATAIFKSNAQAFCDSAGLF